MIAALAITNTKKQNEYGYSFVILFRSDFDGPKCAQYGRQKVDIRQCYFHTSGNAATLPEILQNEALNCCLPAWHKSSSST